MAPNLPLSLRVAPRPPAVIVDGAFALSPMGLAVTMALSGGTDAWLPRGLATLFDNDIVYQRRPEQMAGDWLGDTLGGDQLAGMAAQLEPWRRAWQNGRLSSRVHWIGEAQFESALPDRDRCTLLPRFERCCASLDLHRGDPTSRPLDDCARDVIALAGALQPERVYVLTLAGRDGPPPLARWLPAGQESEVVRQWNGLPDWSDPVLGPAFAPLATLGACAAIVQIIAPAILALPDGWNDDEWDEAGVDESMVEDLWLGARMLWRPLLPMGVAA
jgi:hypothetical protein